MFETSLSMAVTEWGNKTKVDEAYHECWQPLKKYFSLSTDLHNNDIGKL